MNQITELYAYIKELLERDPLVNTITRGDISNLDANKMDISPLAHVEIDSPSLGNSQTIKLDVTLTVLDLVDYNNEIEVDKFWKQDNEVDVENETFAVINRLFTILYRDFEDKGFKADENGSSTRVKRNKDNMIGWEFNFTVEMPNQKISLCS